MKLNDEDEQRITRWIDGELSDNDVADLLSAHPELADEKKNASALGDLLRQELQPDREADVPEGRRIQYRTSLVSWLNGWGIRKWGMSGVRHITRKRRARSSDGTRP